MLLPQFSDEYNEAKEELLLGLQQANRDARNQRKQHEQKMNNQRLTNAFKPIIEERLMNESEFFIELNDEEYAALTDNFQNGGHENFKYLKDSFDNPHMRKARLELKSLLDEKNAFGSDGPLKFNKVIHVSRY